ncbi:MAG: hypothetical protein PUP92_06760 [Rhizonema sp. PD38]|nr:hypothetical protein [Rhizonema sp. PD38]
MRRETPDARADATNVANATAPLTPDARLSGNPQSSTGLTSCELSFSWRFTILGNLPVNQE